MKLLHRGSGIPERVEHVHFHLEWESLTSELIARLKQQTVIEDNTHSQGGDSLSWDWSMNFEYYGNAVETLQIVLDALDTATLAKVNTTELQHGKCMIQEVLAKIEQVEQKYTKAGQE